MHFMILKTPETTSIERDIFLGLARYMLVLRYIHIYTYTFINPTSTYVGLDMEFVKSRVDCNCIVLYCIYYTFQHIRTRQKPLNTELVTQHELAIIGKRHLNNAYKYNRKYAIQYAIDSKH
jgi:hypothetical protein